MLAVSYTHLKAVAGLETEKPVLTFGLSEQNTYYPAQITSLGGTKQSFVLMKQGEKLADITLNIPGMHNVLDAVAALSLIHI